MFVITLRGRAARASRGLEARAESPLPEPRTIARGHTESCVNRRLAGPRRKTTAPWNTMP